MDGMAPPCSLGVPGVWLLDAFASARKKTEESGDLEAVDSEQIDTGERLFFMNVVSLPVMAEPVLFAAIIRALAEKKSTRKHAIAPGYQAPDIKNIGLEFKILDGTICRSSTN